MHPAGVSRGEGVRGRGGRGEYLRGVGLRPRPRLERFGRPRGGLEKTFKKAFESELPKSATGLQNRAPGTPEIAQNR